MTERILTRAGDPNVSMVDHLLAPARCQECGREVPLVAVGYPLDRCTCGAREWRLDLDRREAL